MDSTQRDKPPPVCRDCAWRCPDIWGAELRQWGHSRLPSPSTGWPYVVRQALLLAFIFSMEFPSCLPELAALIKQLFLRHIVYVCWSQKGICRHYFYLQKVNSGPESEMPLVLFHPKAPRTHSCPFWVYSWSWDRVGGRRPEGVRGQEEDKGRRGRFWVSKAHGRKCW